MQLEEMIALFKKHEDEYLKYTRIENPDVRVRDLAAFQRLDILGAFKGNDVISGAGHDEVWLSADPATVAKNGNENDVIFLLRCGVLYESECDSFRMNA